MEEVSISYITWTKRETVSLNSVTMVLTCVSEFHFIILLCLHLETCVLYHTEFVHSMMYTSQTFHFNLSAGSLSVFRQWSYICFGVVPTLRPLVYVDLRDHIIAQTFRLLSLSWAPPKHCITQSYSSFHLLYDRR